MTTFIIGTGSTWALRAADPAVQRQLGVGGGRLRDRERDAEDGVCAEARLGRRPVELDHRDVDLALLARVHPADAVGDLAVDVRDGAGDALAEPRVAAVAQLDRLVLAGRRAGRHGGRPERTRLEADLDLDGRVAARVEHLAGVDVDDRAHADSLAGCSAGRRVTDGRPARV